MKKRGSRWRAYKTWLYNGRFGKGKNSRYRAINKAQKLMGIITMGKKHKEKFRYSSNYVTYYELNW